MDDDRLLLLSAFLVGVAVVMLKRQYMSSTRLYHAQNKIPVSIYSEDGSLEETKPLHQLVREQCPGLFCYTPTSWLFNGHLQTLMVTLYQPPVKVKFRREMLKMSDGGVIALDWFPPEAIKPPVPIIVFLHGLAGGSHACYIQSIAEFSRSRSHVFQFQSVVVHARGCGETDIVTPKFTCASSTHDIRESLDVIHARFPDCPLVLVGFSMGANIMVNYLGEEGKNPTPGHEPHIVGAISVGNPFDMYHCNWNLHSTWFMRSFYSRNLTEGLQNLFSRALHLFDGHPDFDIDIEQVRASKTTREFDEALTRRVFGYHSANEYYRLSSSVLRLPWVRVPLICLQARDDPIAVISPYDEVRSNPHVVLVETSQGGHLGWFSGDLMTWMWGSEVIWDMVQLLVTP